VIGVVRNQTALCSMLFLSFSPLHARIFNHTAVCHRSASGSVVRTRIGTSLLCFASLVAIAARKGRD
jgi:hypothetical protein